MNDVGRLVPIKVKEVVQGQETEQIKQIITRSEREKFKGFDCRKTT